MAKAGRPSMYSDELAVEICTQLASGNPLSRICKQDGFPQLATVYRWLQSNAQFREQYARAREDQADTLADEIIAISDDGENDTYIDEDGKARIDHDAIARSKLRVDARKWVAAKMKPKKYGDKVEQIISGPDGGPIAIKEISWTVVEPSP